MRKLPGVRLLAMVNEREVAVVVNVLINSQVRSASISFLEQKACVPHSHYPSNAILLHVLPILKLYFQLCVPILQLSHLCLQLLHNMVCSRGDMTGSQSHVT